MITEEIKTVDDLLQFVNELRKIHNLRLWYRGVENATWELLPSIQRSEKRINEERFLTNDFYINTKQVMEKCPDKNNYASWMSLMQHYGLPTRMLDWSKSPLISTFFATETWRSTADIDACIWVLAPGKLNKQEKFGDCIYPVDAYTVQKMLLPAFKEWGEDPEFKDRIIACHSTENNLRMYSQQANFTVHNSLRKLEEICGEDVLYKMIIPANSKRYFYESMEVFGITERFIYPDPDHISNDLKNRYNI